MLWFLVWSALVVLAVLVLGRLAWSVFRKGVALISEMGEAGTRLSAIAEQVEHLAEQRPTQLAVFEDPQRLRRERQRRAKQRRRRRARSARTRVPSS